MKINMSVNKYRMSEQPKLSEYKMTTQVKVTILMNRCTFTNETEILNLVEFIITIQ